MVAIFEVYDEISRNCFHLCMYSWMHIQILDTFFPSQSILLSAIVFSDNTTVAFENELFKLHTYELWS